jgi:hypothetical protein
VRVFLLASFPTELATRVGSWISGDV